MARYLQSIGMSCQVRHQLDLFAASPQGRAAGVSVRTGVFDWIIAPPLKTAAFLDDGMPGYAPGSVVERNGRAYWETTGFHVIHEFVIKTENGIRLDIAGKFDAMAARFDARREKFYETDVSETCFVFANTQNNLDGDVFSAGERHEYEIDMNKIATLQESLDTLFGAPCQLAVISRKDRCSADAARDSRVRLIGTEDSEWKGHEPDWNDALSALLGVSSQNPFILASG